jgi:hypothetical protein
LPVIESTSNPLPPPLYVAIPGVPGGLKAINGEILEDRVVAPNDPPITRDTIDPNKHKNDTATQAVLVETYPFYWCIEIPQGRLCSSHAR